MLFPLVAWTLGLDLEITEEEEEVKERMIKKMICFVITSTLVEAGHDLFGIR
jgi:hypothetical protein